MSDRTTPRTASAMIELPGRWNSIWVVPAEIACDLESELGDAIRERDEAQNQLSQIHRWIERHNQDGVIDSLTYLQNLDRCVDALYDKLEIAIARKQ